jgi:CubicO group peptidase (beta-lactamase class C family)
MRRYRKSLPTPAFSPADADAVMLRFMSAYSVPGAALALIKDGRIVVEKGYGFRDLETHAPAWSR